MGFTARARTAALAAAVAGALVTGVVSAGGQPAQAAGSAAQDGTKAPAKANAKPPATVTLITGDRVDVGADGRVVRLKRGKGREDIGFSVRREAGHTYVVPQDALRPVADGVLEPAALRCRAVGQGQVRRRAPHHTAADRQLPAGRGQGKGRSR
ncbi:hypothetical protein ACRJ4W_20925 [Streptomyces sp. GLT-R25]